MSASSRLAWPFGYKPIAALTHLVIASAMIQPAAAASEPVTTMAITIGPADPARGHGDPGPALVWPQNVLRTVVPPVFYDLDRDGTMDVIAGDDRYVYIFDHLGNPRSGWPRDVGGPMMQAGVADLEDDGTPEILWGTTLPTPRLWAFTPAGVTRWTVDLPYVSLANATCPVIADVDGNGSLEVGIATETGVSLIDADGTTHPGWPYTWPVPINNAQWSAPAIGDLNGDGFLEIVVGNACYPDWGVHVIGADGAPLAGWPKVIKPVWSSPALADLDGDQDLEIIVQEGDPGAQGNRMWVWHHDGTVFPGWPKVMAAEGWSSRSSPAVGDLNADGTLEIVSATADGYLHVLEPDATELPGWPRLTGGVQPIASPSLIDIDEDGNEEIFLTYWVAQAQFVSGWRIDGTELDGFPKTLFLPTDVNSHSSVHVADADADGDLDLTASGSSFGQGRILVFEVDGSSYDPQTSPRDWPKMRRDAANTGVHTPRAPAALATAPSAAKLRLIVIPNPATTGQDIRVTLSAETVGWLAAFDAAGRCLGRRLIRGGDHHAASLSGPGGFFARDAASGTYFLRFTSELGPAASADGRLVLLRH